MNDERECTCDELGHPCDMHDTSGGQTDFEGQVQVPPFTEVEPVARIRDSCRVIYTIMGMVPEGTKMVSVTVAPYPSGNISVHFDRREDAEALAQKIGLPVSPMSTPNQGHFWWAGEWRGWPVLVTAYEPSADRRKRATL